MSAAVVRRRIASPFVAFRAGIASAPFLTIPVGSIIETRQEIGPPGLVEIRVNDQTLFAFTRDIHERAEPLDETARVKG